MIGFKIKVRGAVPGLTLKRRELDAIKKPSWEETGVYWHRSFRPKHFTKAGAREYGYYARKGEKMSKGSKQYKRSYTGQKERKFGHTLPLVFSGESRRLTRMRQVRPKPNGVRVIMRANTLNFRHPKSRIDMRAEMTRISQPEALTLVGQLEGGLAQRLRNFRGSLTKTIR